MANHGVNVIEVATSLAAPTAAATGIPFFVGCAPIHTAAHPAPVNVPVLITSWEEFKDKLGYCEDWGSFQLCEAGYSHFVDFGMQPAIFVNVFDPSTHKAAQTAADFDVSNHKVNLGKLAINDSALVVKTGSPLATLVKDTDYEVYFSNGEMIIELLSTGSYYSAASLNIVYDKAVFTAITATTIAGAIEKVELCMSTFGVIPDMIVAPGWSGTASVAAAMAAKAAAINGLFRAKAIVDVPCGSGGAQVYSNVISTKNTLALTDKDEIVCWPKVKLGNHVYNMSTRIAGLIANVDTANGAPHHSPSNNALKADALVLADGTTEVLLTKAQADILNAGGVMTGLNFMGGFVAWGNYTGCYPTSTDVKDYMISVSRTFDWVANTLVKTFWGYLDTPMDRRLLDTILDTCNIWLNGLTGAGIILGGRCEMLESENPVSNLVQGIVKLHIYMTPPSPAQEIDFTLEYDASYLTAALTA